MCGTENRCLAGTKSWARRSLRDAAEEARQAEMDRALRMLSRGDDPRAVLEALSHGLTNKLMHGPTQALSQGDDAAEGAEAGHRGDEDARLRALLTRIYHLDRR